MGIQGLLPMLKEIQVHGHISQYKGKRLAIDGYVWLHKGAFGCAKQLVLGEKTTKFVDYAMHLIRMLKHFGITPLMVFDGGPLPAKKGTEVSRAKSRAEYLAKAQALEGQRRGNEARECYTKCLDVTPELAYQLIKALRAEGIDYIVAPYEADAQLCFLEREGFVDGIITEDSDLLVFGCKQVIFKLDREGKCVSINRDRFSGISEFPMHGWTDLQFRRMAMLSGCDYLPSIPGIGIKTAHRLLRKYKTVEKLLQSLRLEGSHVVPEGYAAEFSQAELAFIFQRVYHPGKRCLVPLNDFPEEGLKEEDEKWVGLDVPVEIARGMALGDLNPETRLPIVDPFPEYQPAPKSGITRSTSTPLQPSKVVAGPMDAFITRAKLPRPIGATTSGPSRLSDQHLLSQRPNPVRSHTEGAITSKPVKSKFFGGKKSAVQELEDAIQAAKEEIVWQTSDGPDVETQEPHRRLICSSPGVDFESLRSPSPQLSPSSSRKLSRTESETQEGNFISSPVRSRCSTPALSSPLHPDDNGFSPVHPNKRQQLSSPSSPTRTAGPTASLLPETISESLASHNSEEAVFETPRYGRLSRISSLQSILVPPSSPLPNSLRSHRAVIATSSDSVDEEEIVTPSMDMSRKINRTVSSRSTCSNGKRKLGQTSRPKSLSKSDENIPPSSDGEDIEIDEVEERRKEKAKVVAEGWKRKYSIGSTTFPKPRTTRVHKDAPEHTDGLLHDSIFSPPPKKPLNDKPQNVPNEPSEQVSTPKFLDRLKDAKEGTPAKSPLSAFQPKGMFPSLEKFKFTGKIKVRID